MGKFEPIKEGAKYGRLTVKKEVPSIHRYKMWECSCECGSITYVIGEQLKYGYTKSCGCLRVDVQRELKTRHGHTGKNGKVMSSTYVAWLKMRQRCNNINNERYLPNTLYPKGWDQFENFLEDMGEKESGQMFVRIDLNEDYSKSNCAYCSAGEVKKLREKL